eukprot:13773095-Alexandrium_andersonii.AAC.1
MALNSSSARTKAASKLPVAMRARNAALRSCAAAYGQTSISIPCSSTSWSWDQRSPDGTWR